MTALSTAEAALRRAPDDPGVPVTVSGAEAAALVAELDRLRTEGGRLRVRGDELEDAARCAAVAGDGWDWARLHRACRFWREARRA